MQSSIRTRTRRAARVAATAVLAAMLAVAGQTAATSQPDEDVAGDDLGEGQMGVGVRGEQQPRAAGFSATATPSGPQGIDVSHWQGDVDWQSVRDAGIEFAWIKATEADSYTDPQFADNYIEAHEAGVIRGAYHFARPAQSSGAAQASFFASNGGAWSADDLTLPGVLDIEANPSGEQCYDMTQSQLRNWILDFHTTYKELTGRDAIIYTSPSFWRDCTGGWDGMASRSPLWVANWIDADGPNIPPGFSVWTAWQYTSTGSVAGVSGDVDRNVFNGTRERLLALANNG
ncbi:GH25 family lysozyme [Georgenia alba]|uniref:GH25 family lysozyme n=1 Tax=Georgenia alba TaxID=2233858 RepID=A0ABW2Q5B6_9MICO